MDNISAAQEIVRSQLIENEFGGVSPSFFEQLPHRSVGRGSFDISPHPVPLIGMSDCSLMIILCLAVGFQASVHCPFGIQYTRLLPNTSSHLIFAFSSGKLSIR